MEAVQPDVGESERKPVRIPIGILLFGFVYALAGSSALVWAAIVGLGTDWTDRPFDWSVAGWGVVGACLLPLGFGIWSRARWATPVAVIFHVILAGWAWGVGHVGMGPAGEQDRLEALSFSVRQLVTLTAHVALGQFWLWRPVRAWFATRGPAAGGFE